MSDYHHLAEEWDEAIQALGSELREVGEIGNADPAADFDINPYYPIRPGATFSRYIDVVVISRAGAYKNFVNAVYRGLSKLRNAYRVGISPQIPGWTALFNVYLECDQAQVWCPDKRYFEFLRNAIESVPINRQQPGDLQTH
jgi:hypothetical protein